MEVGLYVVSTPIGNLSDLSARAEETLRAVSLIYAEDTRRSERLLRRWGFRKPLRSLHAHNEAARTQEVLAVLESGKACALVTDAGTPLVSDPGVRLVAAVFRAGHKVVPIPGPSAVLSALAVAGLPADRFSFMGFAPRRGSARAEWMTELARLKMTVVLFESPLRVGRLLADLEAHDLGDRRIVVCRELTKLHEETRYGTVTELAGYYRAREVRGEVTLVLEGAPTGSAASRSGTESDLATLSKMAEGWAHEGMERRDIARELREVYGLSRNEAYELSLKVQA